MKRVLVIALTAMLVTAFSLGAFAWLFDPGDDGTMCQGGGGDLLLPNWLDITGGEMGGITG